MMSKPTIDVTMLAYREPDVGKNVASWLPHARKIVVVVGGTREVERIGLPATDPPTEDAVRRVADPDKQIKLITRSDYWAHKNEMGLTAHDEVSADLIWQVDADEYYRSEDIERVRAELAPDGTLSQQSLVGFPHFVFWKSTSHILARRDGNDAWMAPARIWRRRDGEAHLHIPFSRVRRADGREEEVGYSRIPWGRCYHTSWCGDDRIRFRLQFHAARGGDPLRANWLKEVWQSDSVPDFGVHPLLPDYVPVPYSGPLPEALLP